MKTVIRNNKGFTLIEMAIVLVIIGIIIGAVVKGQDLIVNAQSKQLTTAVNTWRSLAYAYLDRNGRLPGDIGRDGNIGNGATEILTNASATNEIASTLQNAPANPIVVGSMSFWIYFGNTAAATPGKNAIVLCKNEGCSAAFTADELEMIKSVDTAIDGAADGGMGQFRAVTTPPTVTAALTAPASGQVSRVVTTATAVSITAVGATTPWATTHTAAVFAFDRPF